MGARGPVTTIGTSPLAPPPGHYRARVPRGVLPGRADNGGLSDRWTKMVAMVGPPRQVNDPQICHTLIPVVPIPEEVIRRIADSPLLASHIVREVCGEDAAWVMVALAEDADVIDRIENYGPLKRPLTHPDKFFYDGTPVEDVLVSYMADDVHTPPVALARWALYQHEVVRIAVAGNPSTPPEVLDYLAADVDFLVRGAAAANPSTPIAALRDRLTDGVAHVRAGLAANPAAPLDVVEVLIQDADQGTLGDLLLLYDHARQDLLSNAAGNPAWAHATDEQLLTHLVHHRQALVREVAASEQQLPDEGWEILAKDPDDAVRVAVAQHTTLDSVLAHLARDPDAQVRKAVAKNPHTNPLTLMSLAADSVWPVAKRVCGNPAATPETLHSLVERAELNDDKGLVYIAANPSTPPEVLTELTGHRRTNVRHEANRNPSTPPLAKAHALTSTSGPQFYAPELSEDDLHLIITEPTTSGKSKAAAMRELITRGHADQVRARYGHSSDRKTHNAFMRVFAELLG